MENSIQSSLWYLAEISTHTRLRDREREPCIQVDAQEMSDLAESSHPGPDEVLAGSGMMWMQQQKTDVSGPPFVGR